MYVLQVFACIVGVGPRAGGVQVVGENFLIEKNRRICSEHQERVPGKSEGVSLET